VCGCVCGCVCVCVCIANYPTRRAHAPYYIVTCGTHVCTVLSHSIPL